MANVFTPQQDDPWLVQWIFWVLSRIQEFGIAIVETVLQAIYGLLPASVQPNLAELYVYGGFINSWVPLDFGIGLLGVYVSIWIISFFIGVILSMIPGVR